MSADECNVPTTNDPMSTLCRNVHAPSVNTKLKPFLLHQKAICTLPRH